MMLALGYREQCHHVIPVFLMKGIVQLKRLEILIRHCHGQAMKSHYLRSLLQFIRGLVEVANILDSGESW